MRQESESTAVEARGKVAVLMLKLKEARYWQGVHADKLLRIPGVGIGREDGEEEDDDVDDADVDGGNHIERAEEEGEEGDEVEDEEDEDEIAPDADELLENEEDACRGLVILDDEYSDDDVMEEAVADGVVANDE